MSSQSLKQRLSSLRRGQSPPGQGRPTGRPAAWPTCSDLGEWFPEGAICDTPHGELFVCRLSLHEVHADARGLTDRYLGAFSAAADMARSGDSGPHLELLASGDPTAAALIDTETAGFHGRPLFLVGLMRYEDGELILEQHFARDYSEEAGVLGRLAELLTEVKLLISFNGKAFDWPFVRDRMVFHRLRCRPSFAHLDLLHPSRRRWRSTLPNCRLQTLERYLSGRWRSGDIPSSEIPQRYHDFVREQDARLIAPVFHHNRLDLITMTELLVALVDSEG